MGDGIMSTPSNQPPGGPQPGPSDLEKYEAKIRAEDDAYDADRDRVEAPAYGRKWNGREFENVPLPEAPADYEHAPGCTCRACRPDRYPRLYKEAGSAPGPASPVEAVAEFESAVIEQIDAGYMHSLESEEYKSAVARLGAVRDKLRARLAPSAGRPMTWTREAPTAPGEYWMRESHGESRGIVAVRKNYGNGKMEWLNGYGWHEVAEKEADWAGPIPEPESASESGEQRDPAPKKPSAADKWMIVAGGFPACEAIGQCQGHNSTPAPGQAPKGDEPEQSPTEREP